MKYFILSQNKLDALKAEAWSSSATEEIYQSCLEIEIPDHIDNIVGYSSQKRTHYTLWVREINIVGRMSENDE